MDLQRTHRPHSQIILHPLLSLKREAPQGGITDNQQLGFSLVLT